MIEAWKIGVSLAMTSNAGQILGVLGRDLFGLGKKAEALTGQLNAAKVAAIGAMGVIAGAGALLMMTKLVEKAIAFNQQLAQMKMANYAPQDIAEITQQAYKTTFSVPGSNMTDNLKNLIDLRNISGSAEHAVALSEMMAKTNLVLANVSGKPAEQAGYKFAKFLEDSGRMMDPKTGQFSEARVAQQGQWMQAVIAGMNARVTGDDLFQLRQSGKASVNALSDEGLTNLLPFIQSLGPVAVGTALQGAQQQLLGAVQLRKHTVEWMEKYKLLDPSKVHAAKGGFFKMDPGAVTNEQTLMHDLAGWVWNTVLPKMMASGLSREGALDEVRRSGLRTPLLGFIAEAFQNQYSQQKEIGNVHRAMGVDQYAVMNEESPTFRITKFHEAWTNMLNALGQPLVEHATKALGYVVDGMNMVTQWAVKPENKEIIRIGGEITAMMAGVVAALGTLAVGTAAATAMASLVGPAGFLILVGGAAVILAMNMERLHGALQNLMPDWMKPKTDATGAPAVKGGDIQLPWWAPIPAGPGGRAPSPFEPKSGEGPLSFQPRGGESGGDPAERIGAAVKSALSGMGINMDGRKVGELVSNHQADQASRPMSGGNAPDPRLSPLMPGLGAAWAVP